MKYLSLILLASLLFTSCAAGGKAVFSADPNTWLGGYAECEIIPDDPQTHRYYVAGYKNNNPATGILDYQKAKAVYLEADGSAVMLIAIDCVGLSSKQIAEIKKEASLPRGIAVHVVSTHTHAGIDTFGLWGEVAVDGKDEAFNRQLTQKAAEAAKAAYAARGKGTLFFGYGSEGIEALQQDSRTPHVYDQNLYQLRFEAENGKDFRIIDYAAHAEALRSENTLISADYPRYLSDAIKRETGDDTLYLPGAIGGLIMTKRLSDAEGKELPVAENAVATGELLAKAALAINNERALAPKLSQGTKEIEIPLDNKVFVAMASLGILTNEITSSGEGEYGLSVKTSVSLARLGDLYIVSVPGELFPELAYQSGKDVGLSKTVSEILDGDFMIVGLCNDEIGYIIPPSDFLLDETDPYLTEAKEPNGKKHYEETNSVGPKAAELILSAIDELYRGVK